MPESSQEVQPVSVSEIDSEEKEMKKLESSFTLIAELKGHSNRVTRLSLSPDNRNCFVSCSDRSLIVWHRTEDKWMLKKQLRGHKDCIADVALSRDGGFALTASWDGKALLWALEEGEILRTFVGHTKALLSVCFSHDNRLILTGSRDRTVKLWNTLGVCKYTFPDVHKDWVSVVSFGLPLEIFISAGWDKLVKIWNTSRMELVFTLHGHQGYINSVGVASDGSVCASGGKDGLVMIWDMQKGSSLNRLDVGDIVHAISFDPLDRKRIAVAAALTIQVWDLESSTLVARLKPDLDVDCKREGAMTVPIHCLTIGWSGDGNTLFAGYSDSRIRLWRVDRNSR